MPQRWHLWGVGVAQAAMIRDASRVPACDWPPWAQKLARRVGEDGVPWCVLVEMDEDALLALTSRDPAVLARELVADVPTNKKRRK